MIRFVCPGCKSVLSGRDKQAGKIVTCPKCGQRMQAPQPAATAGQKRVPARPASRRMLRGCISLACLLFLAGASGGIWWWTHSPSGKPEPSVAALNAPPPSSKASDKTPPGAEEKIAAATATEQASQPLADAPGLPFEELPSLPPVANAPGSPPVANAPGSPPVADAPGSPIEGQQAFDPSPDFPFDLVDAINVQRSKAGVEPIFLDAEMSRICQSRAEQLAQRTASPGDKSSSANRMQDFEAAETPLTAVGKWLQDPKRRTAILEPRLRTFGAGYARNEAGQWFSVFDWTHGLDREPLDATPVTGAVVYPAPGQTRVPLWFPGNETPDPLPQTKDKLAGYPITLVFPEGTRIEGMAAHLSHKGEKDVPVWLSSPEKPANPRFDAAQRSTICLIAKKPLRPNTRYHVEVLATVNGAAWSAKWDFLTVSEGELYQEMAGAFLRTLNRLRRSAGLPPVPLHAERSKACATHVRYLTLNLPGRPTLNWNEEKSDLPGYTAEGGRVARTASIQAGGGPSQAVAGLIDSIISRPRLLNPRLRDLGLGYAPFIQGGWLWVIDLHTEPGREADREYFYPAPDQENVPLNYPPNELPSPVPADHKSKPAGYAITALFGPRTLVRAATAKLVDDKGSDVDGWLSSPAHPAIAGFPQYLLCFLPKAPLRPGTRYTAMFQAEVNGRPWRRTWRFTTLQEPDRYAEDLDEKILTRVNAVRRAAGLRRIHLDAELSRACQSHARYLALNHQRPAAQGLGVHRQDADLPGATPEGARAAKASVIAVMLDPQGCVENWMATLYHRIPLLQPDLERIGFGHARIGDHKWACVLDTGNGRAARSRQR